MQAVPFRKTFAARHAAVGERAVAQAERAPIQSVRALGAQVAVRGGVSTFLALHAVGRTFT